VTQNNNITQTQNNITGLGAKLQNEHDAKPQIELTILIEPFMRGYIHFQQTQNIS